jgi:hypothetical protein
MVFSSSATYLITRNVRFSGATYVRMTIENTTVEKVLNFCVYIDERDLTGKFCFVYETPFACSAPAKILMAARLCSRIFYLFHYMNQQFVFVCKSDKNFFFVETSSWVNHLETLIWKKIKIILLDK